MPKKPLLIPFDYRGNMKEHGGAELVGYRAPDGTIFRSGVDYNIRTGLCYGLSPQLKAYKDEATCLRMTAQPLEPYWEEPDWRENFIFPDTMTFTSRFRCLESQGLKDSLGRPYHVSKGEFVKLLEKVKIGDDGRVRGLWTFAKHGSKYSLKLVEVR